MSTSKTESYEKLGPDDIIPGDYVTTIWRWCVRNNWVFVIDFAGGEPKVDQRCAWAMVSPDKAFSTAKNTILGGLTRYPGNTVLLSDVMRVRDQMDA